MVSLRRKIKKVSERRTESTTSEGPVLLDRRELCLASSSIRHTWVQALTRDRLGGVRHGSVSDFASGEPVDAQIGLGWRLHRS